MKMEILSPLHLGIYYAKLILVSQYGTVVRNVNQKLNTII